MSLKVEQLGISSVYTSMNATNLWRVLFVLGRWDFRVPSWKCHTQKFILRNSEFLSIQPEMLTRTPPEIRFLTLEIGISKFPVRNVNQNAHWSWISDSESRVSSSQSEMLTRTPPEVGFPTQKVKLSKFPVKIVNRDAPWRRISNSESQNLGVPSQKCCFWSLPTPSYKYEMEASHQSYICSTIIIKKEQTYWLSEEKKLHIIALLACCYELHHLLRYTHRLLLAR